MNIMRYGALVLAVVFGGKIVAFAATHHHHWG